MIPPVAPHASSRPRRGGFTLIELLTVIAIIGILAAIIIPVVGKVRSTAKRAQGVSNLRQLTLAGMTYSQENGGRWFATINEDGKFYTERLSAYLASKTGNNTPRSDLFYDPLLPNTGDNHFAALQFYFWETCQWMAGMRRYHNFNNIKSPGKTVLFADIWVDKNVTEGWAGSWGTIQHTGANSIWGYPGIWGDGYTPSESDGNRLPADDFGTSGGQLDLTRDPGQTKLGFMDGHVAVVKRAELYHRLFDPRFE